MTDARNTILNRIAATVIAIAMAFALGAVFSSASTQTAHAATKVTVPKVTVSKVTRTADGLKVTWKKVSSSKATGYQIRYSTNKDFKSDVKKVTVNKVTATSKTIEKLKSAKTYYVQMRAYKKVGKNTYYSNAWSATKSVHTKFRSTDKTLAKNVNAILDKSTVGRNGAASLKKAFVYVAKMNFTTAGKTAPKSGKINDVKAANLMVKNKGGNCYESAALFCWLAKGLGYDAKVVCGKTSDHAHGWVEVKYNGKWVICDPNTTNTLIKYPTSKVSKDIKARGLKLETALYLQSKSKPLFNYVAAK